MYDKSIKTGHEKKTYGESIMLLKELHNESVRIEVTDFVNQTRKS